jgi:hypothetical protein
LPEKSIFQRPLKNEHKKEIQVLFNFSFDLDFFALLPEECFEDHPKLLQGLTEIKDPFAEIKDIFEKQVSKTS